MPAEQPPFPAEPGGAGDWPTPPILPGVPDSYNKQFKAMAIRSTPSHRRSGGEGLAADHSIAATPALKT